MEAKALFEPNPGKQLERKVGQGLYLRIPVRTKLITATDDIADVAREFVASLVQPGDMVVVSEKAVAITQGRFYHVDEVKPSFLARLLARFVHYTPAGANLRDPKAMELTLREVGRLRALVGAIVGGIDNFSASGDCSTASAARRPGRLMGPGKGPSRRIRSASCLLQKTLRESQSA